MGTATELRGVGELDRALSVDQHGIEPIPDGGRDSTAWQQFWIWFGANVSPLVLSEVFAVSIQRGGQTFAGVPFALASAIVIAALLLAARATRTLRATRPSTA